MWFNFMFASWHAAQVVLGHLNRALGSFVKKQAFENNAILFCILFRGMLAYWQGVLTFRQWYFTTQFRADPKLLLASTSFLNHIGLVCVLLLTLHPLSLCSESFYLVPFAVLSAVPFFSASLISTQFCMLVQFLFDCLYLSRFSQPCTCVLLFFSFSLYLFNEQLVWIQPLGKFQRELYSVVLSLSKSVGRRVSSKHVALYWHNDVQVYIRQSR